MASQNVEQYDPTKYWKNRDYQTSLRLTAQHWIWSHQLRYTLDPTIAKDLASKGEEVRVADVACGNGAWLIDLARQNSFSTTTQFTGYDITPVHFPAKAFLPPNISLKTWDVFTPPRDDMVAAFDVVHIRALSSVLTQETVKIVIGNVVGLLKPGGYLQWDEFLPSERYVSAPSPDVTASASHQLTGFLKAAAKARGRDYSFLTNLPTLFPSSLKVIDVTSDKLREDLLKACTDNLMTVDAELGQFLPVGEGEALVPGTRQWYEEMFGRVVEEVGRGVGYAMPWQVVVGRRE